VLRTSVLAELLYLEDLQRGQRWVSPSRRITAEDVANFAGLTGDHTPLHGNLLSDGLTEGGEASPFGRPVVHGLLGLSIMAGLSSECPRVCTLALVSMGAWEFRKPIYFGDAVRAEVEIVLIEPHGRRAGRVFWRRQLCGEDGQVYQEGEMETLVARRVRAARANVRPEYSTPAVAANPKEK